MLFRLAAIVPAVFAILSLALALSALAFRAALEALASEPSSLRAAAHIAYADALAERGRHEEAFAESRKSVELYRARP